MLVFTCGAGDVEGVTGFRVDVVDVGASGEEENHEDEVFEEAGCVEGGADLAAGAVDVATDFEEELHGFEVAVEAGCVQGCAVFVPAAVGGHVGFQKCLDVVQVVVCGGDDEDDGEVLGDEFLRDWIALDFGVGVELEVCGCGRSGPRLWSWLLFLGC